MTSDQRSAEEIDAQVETIMAASRVLVAVSAESLAATEDVVTPQQIRALVAIASHGTLSAATLADALDVHASSATRLCDRLVAADLLDRREDPTDRRYLVLELTRKGRQLLATIMRRRRRAIKEILSRIPEGERAAVSDAFERFAAAGGEASARDLWALGWQS